MKSYYKNNKLFEFILIGFFVITAFFLRKEGFDNGGRFSFDEALYVSMAIEMSYDISHYNAINYCLQYPPQRQQSFPPYLWKKLFKHPPMYCYLILFSYKIHKGLGLQDIDPRKQAAMVSIIMGIIAIIAIYLIGQKVFGQTEGILAALFLAIDPVHWICSQKIWMETTITTFILLSGLFYVYSYRKKDGDWLFFLLTGLSIGCAALTKYPGAIALIVILLYTFISRYDLLKYPKWYIIPMAMILVLIHWIMWNFDIYGMEFIFPSHDGFEDTLTGYRVLRKYIPFLLLICAIIIGIYFFYRKKIHERITIPSILKNNYLWLAVVFFCAIVAVGVDQWKKIIPALSLFYEPPTSWRMGFFKDEPKYFYMKKLFEYFPVYLFGYISPFFISWKEREHKALPVLFAYLILIFFIFWGNFQSRYILPAIPWFLLLSAYAILFLNKKITLMENKKLRILLYSLLWGFTLFSIAKAIQVDVLLAWTNKPCYF